MTAARCCSAAGTGGRLAQLGRAKLRADMSVPSLLDSAGLAAPLANDRPADGPTGGAGGSGGISGCRCARCGPPRWTAAEVDAAVRHLSNRDAVALVLDRAAVSSFTDCPACGAWIPTLQPVNRPDGGEVITLPLHHYQEED